MLMSRYQNPQQNHNIKIVNISLENLGKLRYLGMTVINQNLVHEEIKSRLNSGNTCYHSIQNLLSSCLLYKYVKIEIYKTIILPVVFKGVKLGL
jgi:hypothetical protein